MTTNVRNAAELVADLEGRIAAGSLQPGDRLRPVRTVAAELGLAPNTVAGAYRTLRDRGFTVSRGRAGTFVAGRPALGGAIAEDVPEGMVDLANGHPDPALLPDLADALRGIAYEPATYSTSPMDPELARVFAEDLSADGIDPSHMAVVGGALDGCERVMMAHLRSGDTVAVEDPAYASVLDLLAAMGLRAVPVGIDDEGPLPEALDRAFKAGCRAAVITPRAQNPTGAAITADRAEQLRAVVAAHSDRLLIEDDHAGQVAGAPHRTLIDPAQQRWAVIRSVSKSLGPDLRLAVVAADATTVSRIAGRQAAGTGWVSHVLQTLVVHLRRDQGDLLRRAESTYAHRRNVLIGELTAAGVAASGSSGLNVWIPVNDEAAVVAAMQQRGYAIRSGARFRLDASRGVRVTVASSSDDELDAVARALVDVLAPAEARRTA